MCLMLFKPSPPLIYSSLSSAYHLFAAKLYSAQKGHQVEQSYKKLAP